MKQAQSHLGHSTIKTTMNVYTHVTKEDEEETADIFAAFMEQGKSLGQNLGQKKSPLKWVGINVAISMFLRLFI